MDASYSREWMLKAVRSGLLEPQRAAQLLRAESTTSLGRMVRTRQAPSAGAGHRDQITRLDLCGAPTAWATELTGSVERLGQMPNAVLVDGTSPDLDIEPWQVHHGLADLVRTWLQLAPRRESLRLVYRSGPLSHPLTGAVTAFCRSLNEEEHAVHGTVLAGVVSQAETETALHEIGAVDACRCHERGTVWVPGTTIQLAPPVVGAGTVLRAGGCYLITGGLGALGFTLAQYLAREYQAHLILVGTRPASATADSIGVLRSLGGNPRYLQINLADPGAASALAAGLADLEDLNGVVHCAGTTRDALLRFKTREQAEAVLMPKLRGIALLDELTASCDLDFFVAYSSISGLLGNVGQTDYAFANAYLDGFIDRRSVAVSQGYRSGRSVSIAWPFWAEGGISIPGEALERLAVATGIQPMPSWLGVAQFEAAIELGEPLFAPASGDATRWAAGTAKVSAAHQPRATVDAEARNGLVTYLLGTFADLYEIPRESVRPDAALQSYGLDSVLIARLSKKLAEVIPQLPVSVFFTCSTIDELADVISERHPDVVAARFGSQLTPGSTQATIVEPAQITPTSSPGAGPRPMPVAIVGYAARLPQADSAAQAWDCLLAGADLVSSYPANRRLPFGPDRAQPAIPGVTEEDWHQAGSYLDDVWGFDAGFFSVAAREARSMDPQERLALESAWHAFEDAGITPASARTSTSGSVGVFGALTGHTYQQFGGYDLDTDSYYPQSYSWSLANRISSFFDFNGPSETVDTACSSSLYALARACDSLRTGQCSMAVVTATNLYMHPHKFAMLRQHGMLSPTGRCHPFGAEADGFVPAEAVVTVVLKPLAEAERDGDRIHGAIWSWGLNHSGSTRGYTVPSPRAQSEVIRQALRSGGLRPSDISYVETHGTGTALGDPIEVDGLIEVFGADRDPAIPLGIGSVKSNYGHAESAAGLVSLVKVLQQMEHGCLVPSIHASTKNPQLRLDDAPLFVVESPVDWRHSPESPRFAGISSFGAGGSNAHVIIRTGQSARCLAQPESVGMLPFLFTAADQAARRELLARYHNWLMTAEVPLTALASALAHDRTHLDERVCIFARDRNELLIRLALAAHDTAGEGVLFGSTRDHAGPSGEVDPHATPHHTQQVGLWLSGAVVDWRLPRGGHGELSLPLYPFQHRSYHVTVQCGIAEQPSSLTKATSHQLKAMPLRRLDFLNDIPATVYDDREVDHPVVDKQIPEPGIVVLRMDNGNGNLMDTPLYRGLAQAFDDVNHDDSVKVVILTGTDRLFHMGGTQQSLDEIAKRETLCSDGNLLYLGLPSIRVPVISAMTGHAHGGGVTFGLSADIPILAEESLYGASFMNINFTPGIGSTYFFLKRFGPAIAQEMFLTGRDYTGRQLRALGPSIRILPKAEVMAEAMQIARSIAKKSLHALQVYKQGECETVLREIQPFVLAEEQLQWQLFDKEHIETARDDIRRIFASRQLNGDSQAAAGRVTLQSPSSPQSSRSTPVASSGSITLRQTHRPTVVRQAPHPSRAAASSQAESPVPEHHVDAVIHALAEVLKEDPADLDLRRGVSELGLDSVGALELVQRLNDRFGCALGTDVVYTYPRAIDLAHGIAARLPEATRAAQQPAQQSAARMTTAEPEEAQPDALPVIDNHVPTDCESICDEFVEVLQSIVRFVDDDLPDLRRNFQDLGVDSVSGLELVGALNERFGTALQASDLYSYGSALDLIANIRQTGDHQTRQADESAPARVVQGVLEQLEHHDLSVDEVLEILEQR